MSLRFVIGRAGSGKSTLCLREVQEELKQRPRGKTYISCARTDDIPDAEALIGSEDVRGSIRAQVFSFSRLAWKVLQEVGERVVFILMKRVYICYP